MTERDNAVGRVRAGLDLATILCSEVPVTAVARAKLTDAYDALAALTNQPTAQVSDAVDTVAALLARRTMDLYHGDVSPVSLAHEIAALLTASPRCEKLVEALTSIREIVSKRQLPITNQVYEIADEALKAYLSAGEPE